MTFDETEVGRWYWFTPKVSGRIRQAMFSGCPADAPPMLGGFYESEVTDITPVPSQAEFRELVEAAKKIDELSDGYPIRETGTYGIPGSALLALRTILAKLEGKP